MALGGHVGPSVWAKRHGHYLKLPIDASSIVRLTVTDNKFFDHAWLATALASLPRLRCLCIRARYLQNFTSNFEALTPFEHQLDILQLRDLYFTLPGAPLVLLQCFPRTKSIHIDRCALSLSHNMPINCDISPSSIIFNGDNNLEHKYWFRVFSQPRIARGLRHLCLVPPSFVTLYKGGCVELLTRAEILETLEVDLITYVGASDPPETNELITLKKTLHQPSLRRSTLFASVFLDSHAPAF